jgi:hypothetical protein
VQILSIVQIGRTPSHGTINAEDSLDLPFQSLLSCNLNSITRRVLFSSHREDSIQESEIFNKASLV